MKSTVLESTNDMIAAFIRLVRAWKVEQSQEGVEAAKRDLEVHGVTVGIEEQSTE